MANPPEIPDSTAQDSVLETPVGDYELLDFGRGRKLERWGPYAIDLPDSLAVGEPAIADWKADWVYVSDLNSKGHWKATAQGLKKSWSVMINAQKIECVLDEKGRVGLRGREMPCAHWIKERIEGCYDLDEIRVLNLFGGNGYVTAQAVQAGANVVHVEASEGMLNLARQHAGKHQVEYVNDNVMDYVEDALRRKFTFHMIVLPAPALGYGPKGQLWDREVDLPKLVKYLPRLVCENSLGIWLSTDGGAITWKAESLGKLLGEVLPGCTIEPLDLGVKTHDGRMLPAGVAARWYDETDFLQTGKTPLTAKQLEEHLDTHMVSLGAAEEPSIELADFPREKQDFVLRCTAMVSRTSSGMAYNFVVYVCSALRIMDDAGVESWLLHCMDIYDTKGLHPAVAAFKDVENFSREFKARATGLALDDVANILEAFVQGLNGRRLKIQAGDEIYTDTETLFLPAIVSEFDNRDDNFQLYKVMVVHLWAQNWYGTWRIDIQKEMEPYPLPEKALACFNHLESLRLDALIKEALPGVYRRLKYLQSLGDTHNDSAWGKAAQQLQQKNMSSGDSLGLIGQVIDSPLPDAYIYQGAMNPLTVNAVRDARIEADKKMFRLGLLKMKQELLEEESEVLTADDEDEPQDEEESKMQRLPFELKKIKAETPDGFSYEIELDGRPLPPPDNVAGTMASIIQDLGEIPEEYLFAAGDGAYYAGETGEQKSQDVWKGTYHEEGAFLYNEWDYERQNYRKNWAVCRELTVHPTHDHFVDQTMQKYRGLAMEIRRTFEALRGEDKLLKKQPYGDDVDIDALVEALADTHHGGEMTDRLFIKMHKMERNIAVMFMVDMSGSTKGWINDAERESLALLCESLETLGDRYAIYGFSGMTRKRCEIYKIKSFGDEYNEEVKGRISGIQPKDYTRMGVTIRHLCMLLNKVEARTKLLITLSDGKPDDYDGYRGAYGIEDTRMALIEAKRDGIHPFCITIDKEARDYLPHMYGPANYVVIDDVRKLPLKVSDIYRRLTT